MSHEAWFDTRMVLDFPNDMHLCNPEKMKFIINSFQPLNNKEADQTAG